MSTSLSYISSLFGAINGSGSPLLDALYGQSSGASSGQAAVQALASAELNQTQDIKATAAQPTVKQAITAFTAGVQSATSVKQLLANPAVMSVLLTANGMSDQVGYTGLATAALTSNLANPKSLANVLTDTRWKTLASTYNFAANGLSGIKSPSAIAAITKAYQQTIWEQNQDTATPGLANALAFRTQASGITTVDQILANPTLRTVVTTALGVPPEIAFQSLNAQELAISSRLDITQFKDPKFVESFTQRYLIANAGNATAPTTPDLTTLAVQAGGILA